MNFLSNLFQGLFGSSPKPPEPPKRGKPSTWNVTTTTSARQVVSVSNGGAVKSVTMTGNIVEKKLRLKPFSEVSVESILGATIEVTSEVEFPEAIIEADEAMIPYLDVVSDGDELRVGLKSVSFESRTRLHVTIKTPKPVHTARVKGAGSLKLNRAEGNTVNLCTSSMGSLTVEKALAKETAHLHTSGAGSLTVGSLRVSAAPVETVSPDGVLEVKLTSMGSLSIEDAHAYKMICSTSGAGSLTIGGKTEFLGARLTSMGSMDLSRLHSKNTTATSSGMGSLRARCEGGILDAKASGMGSVTILGEPGKVKRMKSSGMGNVSLG